MRFETLALEPSCVAFAPCDTDCLVVGTYHLHGASSSPEDRGLSQDRSGSLALYRLDDEKLVTEQTINTTVAILDIAFAPISRAETVELENQTVIIHRRRLAVASSGGFIDFFDFEHSPQTQQASHFRLASNERHQPFHESILVLDIVWHPTRENNFAVTLSTGKVVLCSLRQDETNTAIQTTQVFSHSLEAWATSYSSDGRFLYSGGDDCMVACHDPAFTHNGTLWKDSKLHSAGITAIHPIVGCFAEQGNESEEILLTGSYDDNIRVVAAPTGRGKKPTVLAELNLGGGVWRLATIHSPRSSPPISDPPSSGGITSLHWIVLASCMYAGVRIVEVKKHKAKWDIRILARFEEHKSMNYGSDVRPRSVDGGNAYEIVSTSFYDKLMCFWRFEPKAAQDSAAQNWT